MISKLDDGKFQVTWPVGTVRVNGHSVTARPETLLALTGAVPEKLFEAKLVGTLAECEAQL